MHFGYGQMWMFRFVPAGFVIVMLAMAGFCSVYIVGATKGSKAAEKYKSFVAYAFVGLSIVDLVWAGVTGDLARFLAAYGEVPLVEMAMLATLGVGSLWFMATSYVNGKRD